MNRKIQKGGSLYDAARILLQIVPPGTEVRVEVCFASRNRAVPQTITPKKKEIIFNKEFAVKNGVKSKSKEASSQSTQKKSSRRMNKRVYSSEICDASDSAMEATDSLFPEATYIPSKDADNLRENSQSTLKKAKSSRRMKKRVYSSEICDASDSEMEETDSLFPGATFIPKEDADKLRSNHKLPVYHYSKKPEKKEETYEEFGNTNNTYNFS